MEYRCLSCKEKPLLHPHYIPKIEQKDKLIDLDKVEFWKRNSKNIIHKNGSIFTINSIYFPYISTGCKDLHGIKHYFEYRVVLSLTSVPNKIVRMPLWLLDKFIESNDWLLESN